MIKHAVIFGYSGHAYVVLDMLKTSQYDVVGYYDNQEKKVNPFNLQYYGNEQNEHFLKKTDDCSFFLGIGDNKIRSAVYEKITHYGCQFPALLHPKSFISSFASIGLGSVVMAGVVINAMAKIGNAVICNSSAVIEHECLIDDYAHIAPGAVLAGNVTVGKFVFIGANAVIKQGVTIGSGAMIGAGAVVTKNVPANVIVYGNPAK